MIYFDNAATGGFKPRAVTDAADNVLRYLSANPGRSGHRLSLAGAEIVYGTRSALAETFNCNPDRVIFTKNCTEALNYAIFGSLVEGGHVITTAFEHNSVLRPLHTLENKGLISLDVIFPDKETPIEKLIEEKITPATYMIVTTSVSNVTGELLPIDRIGKVAKAHNLLYLVDGAQGGGHIQIDIKSLGISYLALAGHKGLYGIMGSGALLINDDADLSPILFGGTGSESFNLNQPESYPERLESGTLNLPAIAALGEGVRFIKSNLNSFANHLISSTSTLIDGLKRIPKIECFSSPNPAGIVAFLHKNIESTQLADLLNEKFDVAVRGGLHCAPLMHKHLKTDKCGLIRVSLAVQNSSRETAYFLSSLSKLCQQSSKSF